MLSIGKSYEVAFSQELGRYMITNRDLEMGEIIFEEMPLISAPERGCKLICPGCYKTIDDDYRCGKCNWPICNPKCTKLSAHYIECNLVRRLSQGKTGQQNPDWQSLSDGLMLVRCLSMKTEKPEKWEELWKMETNWDRWARSPLYKQAEKMVKILRENYEISPELHSTKEILHIQAVLDINAYEIRLPEANVQASYILASIVEHNCVPNTHRVITGDNLILTLRASTKIEKGAHLSTSYCDMLWPTLQRQNYLKYSKFFICHCHRCKDPTEMGSYLSSFLCPECPEGTLLDQIYSETELEAEDSSFARYKCPVCHKIFDGEYIKKHLDIAEAELEELDKNPSTENSSVYEDWILKWSVMPQLLKEKSTTEMERPLILHPHHCLVLDACHTAFLMYSTEESSTTEELIKKENVGTHLLKATKSIIRGISKFQGTVMYELAMAKTGLLLRFLEEPQKSSKLSEKLEKLAKESLALLQDSINLLQYEPKDTPEGQLVQTGSPQLTQLKSFVQEIFPHLMS